MRTVISILAAAAALAAGASPASAQQLQKTESAARAVRSYTVDEGAAFLREALGRHGYTVLRTVPDDDDGRYVYFRQGDGAERRARVRPGGERLRFIGVPPVVLRELVAKMY